MYKLPLKIAGIIISIVLFVMASEIPFYSIYGNLVEPSFHIGYGVKIDGQREYILEGHNRLDGDIGRVLLENDVDRGMLEVQIAYGEEIAENTDRIVKCLDRAFEYIFRIFGAIIFVFSLCIKTPIEERLIDKIKPKKKLNQKAEGKFCRICGEKISETARFCPVCGSDTATAEISPTTSSDSGNYQ